MSRKLLAAVLFLAFLMGSTRAQDNAAVGPLLVGTTETVLGDCELWLPGSYTEVDAEYLSTAVVDLALVLHNRLGEVLPAPFQLMIVTNSEQMRKWTGRDLPEWIRGLAISHPSRLVILGAPGPVSAENRERLESLILHELTHAYLQRITTDDIDMRLPAWFHEGLAIQMSGGMARPHHKAALWGRWLGNLYTLSELGNIPHESARGSELAYAQSILAIQLLTEEHGNTFLPDVLDELRRGNPFIVALRQAIGEPLAQFEQRYRARINRRYNILLFASDPSVIFALLPLLLIAAYFITVVRARRRKAQWAVLEEADQIETIILDDNSTEKL